MDYNTNTQYKDNMSQRAVSAYTAGMQNRQKSLDRSVAYEIIYHSNSLDFELTLARKHLKKVMYVHEFASKGCVKHEYLYEEITDRQEIENIRRDSRAFKWKLYRRGGRSQQVIVYEQISKLTKNPTGIYGVEESTRNGNGAFVRKPNKYYRQIEV